MLRLVLFDRGHHNCFLLVFFSLFFLQLGGQDSFPETLPRASNSPFKLMNADAAPGARSLSRDAHGGNAQAEA